MTVYILATCRKFALIKYTTLVFDTIRVGFPTAEIKVFGNALAQEDSDHVEALCGASGASYVNLPVETIHHKWIEYLIILDRGNDDQPFWICDTDMVFYEKVEDWKFETAIAGYRVPEWQDNMGCIHRSRLHTSLMYINPVEVRKVIAFTNQERQLSKFMPPSNLIYPLVVPFNGKSYFNDTMSLLYHAIGGTSFTDRQKDAYFHFNFGTIPDVVKPLLDDFDALIERRNWILEDPQRGRGLWREGEEYFANHHPVFDGTDVIAKIKKSDGEEAAKWNMELCMGREDAMAFCNLWYHYCHGIDDLVDTLLDGRPTMSKQQMISLFFNAAILYNSSFFVANREVLFPIVLQVTDDFQNSVAWENSSKKHLRAMADVFRTCGNRMFIMVALIVGGEYHMRRMSPWINEKDWLGQHSEDGEPL